jgi:hypothetical protein
VSRGCEWGEQQGTFATMGDHSDDAAFPSGPGLDSGQRVIGSSQRPQPPAVPHAILQVQHAKLGLIAQHREAGAGRRSDCR